VPAFCIFSFKAARANSEALLSGRIFDDWGNRMTPTHARKGGIKYRYYLSSVLLQGQADRAGSIRRIPAAEVEALMVNAVRSRCKQLTNGEIDDRSLLDTYMARVDVLPNEVQIKLVHSAETPLDTKADGVLKVPWRKPPPKRRRELFLPNGADAQRVKPIRAETRATLVASIARGRRWLNELVTDAEANVESIARREKCSVRKINMTISLAFLAPDLVKAAIEGRLSHGIGVARLVHAPSDWSRQRQMLGLPAN
jgi:site-specific DNA recombinase